MRTLLSAALALAFVIVEGGRAGAQTRPAPGARPTLSPQVRQSVTYTTQRMANTIRGQATPPFHVTPASERVQFRVLQRAVYDDHNHANDRAPRYQVSGVGATGELHLVTLLPVSGHVGWTEAQRYATSNQYNLSLTLGDGSRQTLPKVRSTGLVTEHEMTLNLKPGTNVIEFWADGSGGVGGYMPGRRVELVWDGK